MPEFGRFYISPEWRFVVTDLESVVITFLSKLASARSVTRRRSAPWEAQGRVPSDSPEINLLHDDGDPFLSEGNRLIYGFRREGAFNPDAGPWLIRFAGILLQLNDGGDINRGVSDWTAFDPWQYLYDRPALDADGALPDADGVEMFALSAADCALELLTRTISAQGPCRIDAGEDWGGTAFWNGTIEADTEIIDEINFAQGSSVGEGWAGIVETGKCDIVLTPIYDPVDRPGYCADLSIYKMSGAQRPNAIFGWDRAGRSVTDITRAKDGTKRANKVQFYAGQGGAPPVGLKTDAASVAKYGEYWGQQFLPAQTLKQPAAEAWAQHQLDLRSDGDRNYTVSAAPDRPPIPLNDYDVGDRVRVVTSRRLREESFGYVRVEELPLDISDDRVEAARQLVVSPADTTGEDPFASLASGFTGETQPPVTSDHPPEPDTTITPLSLDYGEVGVAYTETLTATGPSGPYTFELASGALPDGLSLSSAGDITGTPTTAGTSGFTVRARDNVGAEAALASYSLQVTSGAPPSPPSTSWPASFFTGPAGSGIILPPSQGVLTGLSPGGPGCDGPCLQGRVETREAQFGRALDLIGLFYSSPRGGCFYPGSDSDPFNGPTGLEDWIVARGSYLYASYTPAFTLSEINAGLADSCWHTLAARAAAWGQPFFLRAFHEFNLPAGPIYRGEGAAHIAAWRRMIGIFDAEGATNVSFVWCPHEGYYTYGSKALNYPGDHYVDWVSSDDYCHANSQWCTPEGESTYFGFCTFDQMFHDNGSVARDFEDQKPYMVGETGVNYNVTNRGDWIDGMYAAIPANFPNLLGLAYFDQDVSRLESGNNWLLDASPNSVVSNFAAMAADPYFNTQGL